MAGVITLAVAAGVQNAVGLPLQSDVDMPRHYLPSCPVIMPCVSFQSENILAEIVEIDPCDDYRTDIDAQRWAEAGELPKKPTPFGSSAWKMEPDRDRSVVHFHVTKGYPTPESVIKVSEAIASRNARELSEQLGHEVLGPWPTYENLTYIPVPGHINPDTLLHIELTPVAGQGQET